MAAGVGAALVRYRMAALLACLQSAGRAGDTKSSADAEPVAPAAGISELSLLRLLGLKGRASEDILADSLSLPSSVVAASYAPLCDTGLCTKTGTGLRLTQAGRDRMTVLLGEERAHADPVAVVAVYEEFCVFDAELKKIVTAWQLRSDSVVNDHRDADYDRGVLQRLMNLHGGIGPLMQRLAPLSPRLAAYGARLAQAAGRIAAGDHGYVAKATADSYHTVWFELHEDLMSLAGLARQPATSNTGEPRRAQRQA
jgi:pyruvate,orthophosphate dikinase